MVATASRARGNPPLRRFCNWLNRGFFPKYLACTRFFLSFFELNIYYITQSYYLPYDGESFSQ